MFSLSNIFQVIPHEQAVQRFAEATKKAAVNGFCHAIAKEALERCLTIVDGIGSPSSIIHWMGLEQPWLGSFLVPKAGERAKNLINAKINYEKKCVKIN